MFPFSLLATSKLGCESKAGCVVGPIRNVYLYITHAYLNIHVRALVAQLTPKYIGDVKLQGVWSV